MRAMRILKIAKVSRTVRLMQQFSELRLILNSMLGSLKNLGWSIAMLALIFYLFALVFVQLTASSLEDSLNSNQQDPFRQLKLDWFGSVEMAMLTLYKACTGGDDWSVPYGVAVESGELPAFLFIFFIAFMQIAVLNILTGIFVEKAMKLAQPDRERLGIEIDRKEKQVEEDLRKMCREMDTDNSGCIKSDELNDFIEGGKLKGFLMTLGLHIKDTDVFFSILDSNSQQAAGSVATEIFIEECMKLKGFATNLDLRVLTMTVNNIVDRQRQWEYTQRRYHQESKELLEELLRSSRGVVLKQAVELVGETNPNKKDHRWHL